MVAMTINGNISLGIPLGYSSSSKPSTGIPSPLEPDVSVLTEHIS
ncbi:hypothetical protein A2U01_0107615, partial [Trifolium medium]|nr:hypothetical protein [Trifolium medium]